MTEQKTGGKVHCHRCGRNARGLQALHHCPHGITCQTSSSGAPQCAECSLPRTRLTQPTRTAKVSPFREPITLRGIADELKHLERSHELLGALFSEIGPYQDGKIIEATWIQVRDHFDFDDSE